MKKYLSIIVLLAAATACFAEGFDDMAYPNPDYMTYFQQEMKSLMRFQTDNDINIPFFASFSARVGGSSYKSDYMNDMYSDIMNVWKVGWMHSDLLSDGTNNNNDVSFLTGFQFRPHHAVYIPVFLGIGSKSFEYILDDEWVYPDEGDLTGDEQMPLIINANAFSAFAGTGVVINTDLIKAGIYAGYSLHQPMGVFFATDNSSYNTNILEQSIKFVFVPLVNTSEWKYVGAVLNSILGFLDTGNIITFTKEEEGDSTADAIVRSINAGLDFTFNRIHFDNLSLKINTVYSRGNFDAMARNDVYGLRVQGQLYIFPLGFTLEGGYKHFFDIAVPKWFANDYPDTVYVRGSVYFPLERITLGLIYGYDSIYQSKITFAVSTNTFSGLFTLNPYRPADTEKFIQGMGYDFGARFRWGGWKVK